MRNFFFFIARNATTIFFILLEILCLVLVMSFNDYQQAKYVSSANAIISSVYESENAVTDYFSLSSRNDILARENNALHNQLDILHQQLRLLRNASLSVNDALPQRFLHREAKVIKSTTNREHNYLTIDRGSNGGVHEGMIAVDYNGAVVGLVTAVTDNFATILPIINTSFRLSSKLKKTNFRGQLVWDAVFPDEAELIDIPEHAVVNKGDSIVTSGSSSYFPEGLYVGTVKDVEMDRNGGFYDLTVQLAVDFTSIYDVYIVEDLLLKEQKQLEEETEEHER